MGRVGRALGTVCSWRKCQVDAARLPNSQFLPMGRTYWVAVAEGEHPAPTVHPSAGSPSAILVTLGSMRSGIRPTTPPNPDQVARRFGLGEVVGEPRLAARGELGRIWRMETAARTWAVKEVFATWTAEVAAAARADLAFQELAC